MIAEEQFVGLISEETSCNLQLFGEYLRHAYFQAPSGPFAISTIDRSGEVVVTVEVASDNTGVVRWNRVLFSLALNKKLIKQPGSVIYLLFA